MKAPREITLPLSWGKLQAQVWGNLTTAPTIVALHGWLDNSNSFVPLLKHARAGHFALASARWVCIDMAGHGKSDWRPIGTYYHYFDYVQDLADVLQALGDAKVHLIGHSLGAGVAAFFAGAFPERVQSLSCLDSLGPVPFLATDLPQHYREFREQWERLRQDRRPRIAKSFSRAVTARRMAGHLAPESAELLVARNLRRQVSGWTWRTDPRLKLPTAYRTNEEEVQAFLKAIECRVLVVEATQGMISAGKLRTERLRAIRDVKQIKIDGGHHVHMDSPERVVPLLERFIF